MTTQHDKQFKLDAVQYYPDHNGLRKIGESVIASLILQKLLKIVISSGSKTIYSVNFSPIVK